MTANNDFNRSVSKIFTNPVFREVVQTGNSDYFFSKVKKYKSFFHVKSGMKVHDIIGTAYAHLSKNYRNEYIYKNTILNKILLGRHSVRTAVMLNEFKVRNSIADIVIINGTSTVYEIKTELDSADKLAKQIQDYKKIFAKVYLVVHNSLEKKYSQMITDNTIGLISLSDRFNLTVVKEASEDYANICNSSIMKSLRKEEYSAIIKQHLGALPEVSNIRFFTECHKLSEKIEPKILHDLMLQQLRKRALVAGDILESKLLPRELKHVCLCINPNVREYDNLFQFLNLNI